MKKINSDTSTNVCWVILNTESFIDCPHLNLTYLHTYIKIFLMFGC